MARIAYDYGTRTGARVVIVDPKGTALVDTSARVQGRESFASRPEIKAALHGRVATGARGSQTLGTQLLYVAVPIASGGVVHGAVRITYPTSTADARVVRYWLMLGAIAATVLAAAALVGVRLARFVTRPLRGLEDAAAAVGAGDLDARAPERTGPPEVRSLARVLNETVAKLGQLLRSQEEFVSDASHELRTPLTALRLRLENLGHGLDAGSRGDLDAALREVDRLAQMIEGLLALARADAGTVPAGAVDADAVLRDRLAVWQSAAAVRDVSIVLDAGAIVPVVASPQRLAQVVDNLVANAVEHSPPGSTVTVSVRPDGARPEVCVRDEGPA